jgi:broad specificity phosphatase PhoE
MRRLSVPSLATRYLYLARHGEALPDESGLSSTGRQQAILLGRRLSARPITEVYHGPLPRAQQTAELVSQQLDGVALTLSPAAGDFVPYVSEQNELPTAGAEVFMRFLEPFTAEEREEGRELSMQALTQFTGPVIGDRYAPGLPPTLLICNDMSHLPPELRWTGFPPELQV